MNAANLSLYSDWCSAAAAHQPVSLVSGKIKMFYSPSIRWTCHFPAMAIIITACACYFIGFIMLFLIIPFLCFYSLLIYLGNRDKAIRILVDQERLFVRQGLNPEIEYNLQEVSSFVLIAKRFKNIFQLKPWEWLFPSPFEPVRLIVLMNSGNRKIIFSYQEASPFKYFWSVFVTKLKLQTGKPIEIIVDEQFDLENAANISLNSDG